MTANTQTTDPTTDAAAEIKALIADVREKHFEWGTDDDPACGYCNEPWPCQTNRITAALDLMVTGAQELLDELQPVIEDDSVRVAANVQGAYWGLVNALQQATLKGADDDNQ